MPDRLAGRRAVVTGASRGIGAAVAERLAAEGADVAVVARTLDESRDAPLPGSLARTRERLAAYGGRVAVVVADLADAGERARILPAAVAALGGPVDILVNNAAMASYSPLATYPLRRRRLTFEVNTHAPIDLAQAVVPAMVERGAGWIVNLSSATARPQTGPPFARGAPSTMGVYGASKAALERLSNALAAELFGTGVRVNTVEPRAAVLTEGADALVGERLRPEQIEPIEAMVEAVLVLCECEPERTGGSWVSLDLLADLKREIRALDGGPLREHPDR